MELPQTGNMNTVVIFIFLFCTVVSGSTENDLDLSFCGTWRHGRGSLGVTVNITTGCKGLSISANQSFLSVDGQITAQCKRSDVIPLEQFGIDSAENSDFCLYWEPLLDQLKLQVGGKNLTLCWPGSMQGSCCTDLSLGPNTPEAPYGIVNAMVNNDVITHKTLQAFKFNKSTSMDCKALCDQANQGSTRVSMSADDVVRIPEHPCARSYEVEMEENFTGYNMSSPVTHGLSVESAITVQLSPALKQAAKMTNKVALTFFQDNSLFQDGLEKSKVLNHVVGITVENEIISDLSEPIKIGFHHDVIPKTHSRKCVSWDTRKDPSQVNWLVDGCETLQRGAKHTECSCNHLTYFSVLVQLEPRPVCHLLALTTITSLGCAVSVISCVVLIVHLLKKSKRPTEQSTPIHLGLTISIACLDLLFFFTGILANVGGESTCAWVGAALHYALLSSFAWMGAEVFHTFLMVCVIFNPSRKPYVWNLVGFAVPTVPIVILVLVGDIYGVKEVYPCEEPTNPYLMCWMKNNYKALLAHYFTNMTILVVLVISGLVMLFLVYREIRNREEWRQNRVAFLSIWGLSCLYGTTWGLTFLDFGPLSDFVLFISCILNSFQGFLLMLRFYMLDWMRKQAGGSSLGSSSSTGSTRQHMLQSQESSWKTQSCNSQTFYVKQS